MSDDAKTIPEFSLRLFAYALRSVFDSGFMNRVGDEFLERKRRRGRKNANQVAGLALLISEDAIRSFFVGLLFEDFEYYEWQGYDADWIIDDLLEAYRPFVSYPEMERCFYVIVEEYWSATRDCEGQERFSDANIELACRTCCKLVQAIMAHKKFRAFCREYEPEIADRLLHDRQLASIISDYVSRLARQGESGRRLLTKRVYWPSKLKRVLYSRDRGKCSKCHVNISMELLAEAHIDHIVPRGASGFNDVINLQLLCSACNLKKGVASDGAGSSIPPYYKTLVSKRPQRKKK